MAKNREMLKEAIAEAKAVKEMAIANAKAALEEAFTPQLKSMLSMKLQEMEMEEGDIYEYSEEHEDPTTGNGVTASDVTAG
jgi:spore coat protein CotF